MSLLLLFHPRGTGEPQPEPEPQVPEGAVHGVGGGGGAVARRRKRRSQDLQPFPVASVEVHIADLAKMLAPMVAAQIALRRAAA